MKNGEVLKVTASDPGFYVDIQSWSKRTENEMLDISKDKGIITALIRKGEKSEAAVTNAAMPVKDNKTMVVFSGDLDKAIASFIIANGAASMGRKVTMFFTFWGLNILRKDEKVDVQKGFMDKMFGMMMPRGSKKLQLSKMNMLGMGGKDDKKGNEGQKHFFSGGINKGSHGQRHRNSSLPDVYGCYGNKERGTA